MLKNSASLPYLNKNCIQLLVKFINAGRLDRENRRNIYSESAFFVRFASVVKNLVQRSLDSVVRHLPCCLTATTLKTAWADDNITRTTHRKVSILLLLMFHP